MAIQSVLRATDILELFLNGEKELSVKEIADEMGLSKSTVHGLIKTLAAKGYLYQNEESSKYQLGMKLFQLGHMVEKQLDIAAVSRPIIHKLVNGLQETVHLVSFDQGEAIYIEKKEGTHSLRIYSQVGRRAPLHCTGVGKAILAFLPEKEQARLLETLQLEAFTEKTIVHKSTLETELADIKRQGFAIDDEEIEIGLKCTASPIFNYQGKVVGSISCAVPTVRLTEKHKQDIIVGIQRAAVEISTALGYRKEIMRRD